MGHPAALSRARPHPEASTRLPLKSCSCAGLTAALPPPPPTPAPREGRRAQGGLLLPPPLDLEHARPGPSTSLLSWITCRRQKPGRSSRADPSLQPGSSSSLGRMQGVRGGPGPRGRSDSEPWTGEAVTDESQEPGICRLTRFSPLCFSSFRLKPASSRQPSSLTSLIHNS